MPTVAGALRQARRRLQAHSDSADLDARLLLAHTLGVSTTRLFTAPQAGIESADWVHFKRLIERRAAGEPLAYISGRCGFWTLELAVDPSVLIPRPDTETLVATALELLPQQHITIADLGTGSGAIALALASERPQWSVTATDASQPALACAQHNAANLQLTQVHFVHGNWFEPLNGQRFDAIVSNPPYIAANDTHLRAPELGHEPTQALVADDHGLAALAHIAGHAGAHLHPGGWLLLEHGFEQGDAVCNLLHAAGLISVQTRRDLGGRSRVTLGRQRPSTGS